MLILFGVFDHQHTILLFAVLALPLCGLQSVRLHFLVGVCMQGSACILYVYTYVGMCMPISVMAVVMLSVA
jgi:hypothetical protein